MSEALSAPSATGWGEIADVTVIIPMHNRADTVPATMASVAAQTIRPQRVIVVDDASTDESVAAVKQLGMQGVEVLEQRPNRGVGAARNAAAALATTKWLAFLDADDSWKPTFLEEVIGAAEALGADFASSGGSREMLRRPPIVRVLDNVPDVSDQSAAFWRIARRFMPIVPSSAVIKRSLFERAGGFETDVRWGEEVPLFARLWLEGRFAFVNRPLYDSAQRPTGMSAVSRSYRDTALHLARLGKTLLAAIARRRPGTRSFAREYARRVYRKHRNWFGGRLRKMRRQFA